MYSLIWKAIMCLALVGYSCTNAPAADFTPLGDLPGGDTASTAHDISADGKTIVGGSKSANSGTTWEAFKWTQESGLIGLGDVPGGIFYSMAIAVSGDGQVVAGTSSYNTSTTGEDNHAFRWTPGGGIVDLGDLSGGPNYSSALGISDDGTTIIGGGAAADGNSTFRWTSGTGMVELPGNGGRDASSDGSVVIGEHPGGPGFRWTQTTGAVSIGSLDGPSGKSEPLKITPDGTVIVGASDSPQGYQAFKWTSGVGMVGLGDLPGGSFSSRALDVSADGSVVVGYSNTGSDNEAFIWDSEHGMQLLADVLTVGGVDLTGWILNEATGISDDGLIIVGSGVNPSGNIEAFKATLPLTLSAPDTVVAYSGTVEVPLVLSPNQQNIVSVELLVAYDRTVVTPASPNATEWTGTLVEMGWSVEENVLSGSGNVDTLAIAMSTAQDTINQGGDLIKLVMVAENRRSPASTPLELVFILFNDGDPPAQEIDGSITIIGTDGTITAFPDSIVPRDTISVQVTDVDENRNATAVDVIQALAFDKIYSDSQAVTLTETGINTGVFDGIVLTEFAASAGLSHDGIIGAIAGDSIYVEYTDSLSAAGTTVVRRDTVEVIGGEDGIVQISYVVQALDGRNGIRDTIRVRITDADLDLDVNTPDQVSATIANTISGEVEALTLLETDNSTGIFQIRVPSIQGSSGANNDGVLSLASWDTLNVSYDDDLTAQGGTATVSDIGYVVNLFGDVQPNDQVQAFDAAKLLAINVGLTIPSEQDSLTGDVDGNGEFQAFDASLVLQYVVRLIDRFPVQTDTSFNPPTDEKNHPFLKPVPLDRIVALGDIQPQSDGAYLLPISLGEREGILAGTFTLGIDPGVEFLGVVPASGYAGFMTAHNITPEGLKIAFAGGRSELSGPGEVLHLKLRSTGDSPIRLRLNHIVLNGLTLTSDINIEVIETIEAKALPRVTQLHQNVPNPFNPETLIPYNLAEAGQVQIVIYNITGQRVRTLVSEFQNAGSYQLRWDGKDALGQAVGSGVYMMQMTVGTATQTRKMLLLQ